MTDTIRESISREEATERILNWLVCLRDKGEQVGNLNMELVDIARAPTASTPATHTPLLEQVLVVFGCLSPNCFTPKVDDTQIAAMLSTITRVRVAVGD